LTTEIDRDVVFSTIELNKRGERTMSTVVVQAVSSLDGYIALPDDTPGPMHDWYFQGDVEVAQFHVSEASAEYLRETLPQVRCLIIGRHLFDFVDGWDGEPPAGDHVFVVTHEAPTDWGHEDAPYTFCTDGIQDAVRRAKEFAGDGVVTVSAGEVAGQIVAAGLADELAIDLAPVFLGQGKKFLGLQTDEIVLDDPSVVIQGERVLHLRYALR
jgi:dihydrofolate reductase